MLLVCCDFWVNWVILSNFRIFRCLPVRKNTRLHATETTVNLTKPNHPITQKSHSINKDSRHSRSKVSLESISFIFIWFLNFQLIGVPMVHVVQLYIFTSRAVILVLVLCFMFYVDYYNNAISNVSVVWLLLFAWVRVTIISQGPIQ